MVQMKGVEPPRLSALDPKSSASANFATSAYYILLLAGIAGFEPTNARVKVWCLTTWRYPTDKNGVNDGTRTHDNQNHNLALYQLNYVHHIWCVLRDSNSWPTP